MSEYMPDRWVVVNLKLEGKPDWFRVFAGWGGGYLSGDSWKLSSGITEVKETEQTYEFTNETGSVYICYKNSYGMSGYMRSIYSNWQASLDKDNTVSMELVEKYAPTKSGTA